MRSKRKASGAAKQSDNVAQRVTGGTTAKRRNTGRGMVLVENVNVPDYSQRVDAIKYAAMKAALLKILPGGPPGMTQTEMRKAVLPHLPDDEFPGGATAQWWSKCVQLDLEAKGIVKRDTAAKPLRWFRVT